MKVSPLPVDLVSTNSNNAVMNSAFCKHQEKKTKTPHGRRASVSPTKPGPAEHVLLHSCTFKQGGVGVAG
jgi:hypothetical protein